ncbi:hypothetical protein B0H13DRAFT_824245 [Mycena leptocephala]|nr:hypothetical protein B0H13DRAFT_824245 [Mycena leptocephala]
MGTASQDLPRRESEIRVVALFIVLIQELAACFIPQRCAESCLNTHYHHPFFIPHTSVGPHSFGPTRTLMYWQ